jgi:hypothetical protein
MREIYYKKKPLLLIVAGRKQKRVASQLCHATERKYRSREKASVERGIGTYSSGIFFGAPEKEYNVATASVK